MIYSFYVLYSMELNEKKVYSVMIYSFYVVFNGIKWKKFIQ